MKILTTLAENDYFLGLAALVNSVVANGTYVDKVVVGYRGDLPSWLLPRKESKNGKSFTLKSGLELELIKLDYSLHLVHEKPKWFKYLTYTLEPNAEEFFFFDSDIIIINRMSFFGEWVKEGVALCEDVNYDMSSDHPIRKQWERLALEEGLLNNKLLNRYFNSGFLGWTRENAEFVNDWDRCFSILAKKSGDMKKFRVKDRSHTVLSANQDSLNLAAMITHLPISTIGPEAMGFHYGLSLMAHPLGPKPWNRKFGSDFFKGSPPRYADILFWENINGTELQPVSNAYAKRMLSFCKGLRGLARIYTRLP